MSEIARFRTAIGGFNRNDVSEYIQKSAAQHQSEAAELKAQIAALHGEVAEAKRQYEQKVAELASREAKLRQLRDALLGTAERAAGMLTDMTALMNEAAALVEAPAETE